MVADRSIAFRLIVFKKDESDYPSDQTSRGLLKPSSQRIPLSPANTNISQISTDAPSSWEETNEDKRKPSLVQQESVENMPVPLRAGDDSFVQSEASNAFDEFSSAFVKLMKLKARFRERSNLARPSIDHITECLHQVIFLTCSNSRFCCAHFRTCYHFLIRLDCVVNVEFNLLQFSYLLILSVLE